MYKRMAQGWLKHLDFILWDEFCLQIALWLGYSIRHGYGRNMYQIELYRDGAIVLAAIDLLTFVIFQTLRDVLRRGLLVEFSQTIKHTAIVMLMFTLYLYMTKIEMYGFSRTSFGVTALLYPVITYLVRILWKRYLHLKMEYSDKRSMVVVTTARNAEKVILDIRTNNFEFIHLKGAIIFDQDWIGKKIHGIEVVSDGGGMYNYVLRQWVDEIFLYLPDQEVKREEIDRIVSTFSEMGVAVHQVIDGMTLLDGRQQMIEHIGNYPVMTTTIRAVSSFELFLKRLMDILGGLIGCMITLILTVVIGPMIKIQSPGPVFFKQTRVGKNGLKFQMYKFRSMYLDAEERKKELMEKNRSDDKMMFKLDCDPRIIGSEILPDGTYKKGIGNFIRDTSLDEFPQFFNILKGDMSLVGTRPPTIDEWEKYELHHRARLAIKPGLTGMWQVSGRSNITDFEEVVRLDEKYITNWSLSLDLKIIFKTLVVVAKRDGSM